MKKKFLITFSLFILMLGTATAPPTNTIFIPEPTHITYYDAGSYRPLMDAIFKYESGCNPFAWNKNEDAVGGFQIRQNRLDHYNILNGTSYKLEDCYDIELSKKIFLYFTTHDHNGRKIPPKSWEQAAKNWNGSGPKTETYWNNVKNLI